MTTAPTKRANPFPGLRPFEESEDDLFFGRDEQVDDLVGRLRRRRLIAVIGTSGSGKSSLVRAGLLPALHGGFMAGAGSRWRIATMRPGSAPIANLATALEIAGLAGAADADLETRIGLTRAGLNRGTLGLVDTLRESDLGRSENVLLLVDQFEELFRFQQDNPNEAAAFVKLLLSACESPDVPVYIILTMRSDFLGDCAQFGELAQKINDGLFLVPRMTWDQLHAAIEMPVRAAGGDIQPAVVTRLLNDLGDNPDQLPVLQHELMRSWDLKPDSGDGFELTLDDLARTGGLENALSLHGDAVLATLGERDRIATEKLFKCITELGGDNRGIRRPTRLGTICAITDTPFDEMCRVVDAFRAPECSFLAVRPGPLDEATVIDIAHEGLMRLWKPLIVWVEEEAQSAEQYRRLSTAATLYATNRAALWRDPDLQIAQNWRNKAQPNAAWANHVDSRLNFDLTMGFLHASIVERVRERSGRTRRSRLIISGLIVLVLIMSAISALAVQQARLAASERVHTVVAQSSFLARDANAALDRGDAVTSMLLALEALKLAGNNAPPEARYALQSALANQRERLVLRGHTDAIEGLAFSPDGRMLASAGADRTLRLWDTATGKQTALFRGFPGGLSWTQFSPDGEHMLTSSDTTARIWDVARHKLLAVFSAPDLMQSATYSHDGRRIVATADDDNVYIWDIASRHQTVLHGHTNGTLYAEFSPDDTRVVSASSDKTVRIWDAHTGAPLLTLRGPTGAIESAVFSPDGRRVVAASLDGTVRWWDTHTGVQLYVFSVDPNGVQAVAFSRDGTQLISSTIGGTIRVWDALKMRPLETLTGHEGIVTVGAFSPDGKRIATGSFDRTVRIWDIANETQGIVFRGSSDELTSVQYSTDGKSILNGSLDGTLRLWDAARGTQRAALRGHRGWVFADFSPDGRRILSAGRDRTMRTWNALTGAPIAVHRGFPKDVFGLKYAPDGRTLAASFGKRIILFDAVTFKPIRVFEGHNDSIRSVRFSPNGKRIVSASDDSSARIWDVASGKELVAIRGHEGGVWDAVFSPDGTRIVTASVDKTVRVWDAANGRQLLVMYGHQGPTIGVAYSPDGRQIASGGDDRTVRLWDAVTGAQMAVFHGHEAQIHRLAYSPDGKHVASTSADFTLRTWDVPAQLEAQALIVKANAAVPRQLSPFQRDQEFLTKEQ